MGARDRPPAPLKRRMDMNRLATIFSIVTTAGVLLATVSGLVWIIAVLRHRETAAKALCIAGIIVAVVGFVLFLRSYDSSLHRARPQEPEIPAAQTAAQGQPQEAPQEPMPGPEDSSPGNPSSVPQEPAEAPEKPVQEPAQAANEANPLFSLVVHTRPVMNGFKTERIGTWAYIDTTKEFMSSVTDQQFYDYLSELSAEGYNWFNVFFEDGTGLWTISPALIEYGQADQDEGGAVEYVGDPEDCIFTFADGRYSTSN